MALQMSFTDAIIAVLVQLAPAFVVLCFIFVLFTWLRLIVDAMTGSKW